MEIQKRTCPSCDAEIPIGQCEGCGRPFVLAKDHLEGGTRTLGSAPLGKVPENLEVGLCDYCTLKARGEMMEAMRAGRRQKTCPVCHADCLSGGGL